MGVVAGRCVEGGWSHVEYYGELEARNVVDNNY